MEKRQLNQSPDGDQRDVQSESEWVTLDYSSQLFAIKLLQGLLPKDAAQSANATFAETEWAVVESQEAHADLMDCARKEALTLGVEILEKRVKKEAVRFCWNKWETLVSQKGQFEQEMAEVFDRLDYFVERTQQTRDGGYDLSVDLPSFNRVLLPLPELPYPLTVNGRTLVECKSQATPVEIDVVRAFAGVMVREGAHCGLIASLGGFTKAAKDEALMITIMTTNAVEEGLQKHRMRIQLLEFGHIVGLDMESQGYSWTREFLAQLMTDPVLKEL